MLETWTLAVLVLMYSSAPIWALVRPAAISWSTASSRPVSPYGRAVSGRRGGSAAAGEVAEYQEGLLMAGGCRGVVADELLDQAEFIEVGCDERPVTEVAEDLHRAGEGGGGSLVVPGALLDFADPTQNVGFAEQMAEVAEDLQCPCNACGLARVIAGEFLDPA
jgi:hypothetical protein